MGANFYSCGVRSPSPGAGAAYVTIHTGANLRAFVFDIQTAMSTTTQSLYALFRTNNTPVASTSQLGQADDPTSPASTVNVDTAWSTAPTIGANVAFRRDTTPSGIAVGFGATWLWDEPVVIPVSSWLVVWNPSGTPAGSDVTIRWYEDA